MNVYILKAGPFFKIGKADDIKARISLLQTGCPYPIQCVAFLEHSALIVLEGLIHKYNPKKRTSGEWFLLGKKDLLSIIETHNFTICLAVEEWLTMGEPLDLLILKHEREIESEANGENNRIELTACGAYSSVEIGGS